MNLNLYTEKSIQQLNTALPVHGRSDKRVLKCGGKLGWIAVDPKRALRQHVEAPEHIAKYNISQDCIIVP